MKIEISLGHSDLKIKTTDIEELPCVKCLMRPICSNTPVKQPIKCYILAEFIRKYSEATGVDIKVTDLISPALQNQLLYIYNKVIGGSK